jgi:hypothetical protein
VDIKRTILKMQEFPKWMVWKSDDYNDFRKGFSYEILGYARFSNKEWLKIIDDSGEDYCYPKSILSNFEEIVY